VTRLLNQLWIGSAAISEEGAWKDQSARAGRAAGGPGHASCRCALSWRGSFERTRQSFIEKCGREPGPAVSEVTFKRLPAADQEEWIEAIEEYYRHFEITAQT
jgi:hypothetical protein